MASPDTYWRGMIPIIITARMTSQRLPGKSLRSIAAKPLLQWVVDNLRQIKCQSPLLVATSTDASDDPIAAWCRGHRVACYRGSLDDLATRLLEAARSLKAGAFVRISGDSPLMDPALICYAIRLFETAEVDLVTNIQLRTFPHGLSVEVVRAAMLEDQIKRHGTKQDQEHVTTVLYRNASSLRIINFTSGAPLGEIRLAVDTEDDFHSIEKILKRSGGITSSRGWRQIVELLPAVQGPSVPNPC